MNNLLLILLDTSNARLIFGDLFLSLTWLGFFAAVFFSYYYYLNARNRERMAMIEKGNDLSELYKHKSKSNFRFPWFKLIFTIIGIGVGGILAFLTLSIFDNFINHNEEPFIFLLILVVGALGMLAGHFMDIKNHNKIIE